MALLVADRIGRPAVLLGDAAVGHGHGEVGGGLTLDDAIVGVWEGLAAHAVAACLLCGGTLHSRAGGEETGGRCDHCGTTLA